MARFYAACLASYNAGILHGRWIEASSDIDEMQEAVAAMLRESPCPNVMVIAPNGYEQAAEAAGWEMFPDPEDEFAVIWVKAEHVGVDNAPYVDCPIAACKQDGLEPVKVPSAEEWAMHDSEDLPRYIGEYSGLKPIAEFMELVEEHDDWEPDDLATIISDLGSISEAKSALDDKFCGRYDSFKEYAEEAADEALAAHNIKDNNPLYNYFDYDAYARDLRHDMTIVDLSDGKVAVFYA